MQRSNLVVLPLFTLGLTGACVADFDNDGFKDVFVTNGLMRDIRNTDSDKAVANYVDQVVNDFVKKNPKKVSK